jgi:hypothetical protein
MTHAAIHTRLTGGRGDGGVWKVFASSCVI